MEGARRGQAPMLEDIGLGLRKIRVVAHGLLAGHKVPAIDKVPEPAKLISSIAHRPAVRWRCGVVASVGAGLRIARAIDGAMKVVR
jgi:hypothetical protein